MADELSFRFPCGRSVRVQNRDIDSGNLKVLVYYGPANGWGHLLEELGKRCFASKKAKLEK